MTALDTQLSPASRDYGRLYQIWRVSFLGQDKLIQKHLPRVPRVPSCVTLTAAFLWPPNPWGPMRTPNCQRIAFGFIISSLYS